MEDGPAKKVGEPHAERQDARVGVFQDRRDGCADRERLLSGHGAERWISGCDSVVTADPERTGGQVGDLALGGKREAGQRLEDKKGLRKAWFCSGGFCSCVWLCSFVRGYVRARLCA